MTAISVGTSGWSYPSWRPGFYPASCRPEDFLAHYAGALSTVELNSTKYRLPSEDQFRSWAAQVPAGFRFAVKAPPGVERRLDTFQERVLALGDALGCVRVVSEAPRDEGLIELLLGSTDPGIRWAFDLRDPSWDGIEQRLAEGGAVRVDDESGTAGWAYLRFRELEYAEPELAAISSRLNAPRGQRHRDVRVLPPRRRADRAALGARGPRDESAIDSARMPHLDAIGITTADIAASCRFYRLLGVDVSEPATATEHHEATLPSGLRLMWDTVELMKTIDPDWQPPIGQRQTLAFHCDTAAGVDETYARRDRGWIQRQERAVGRILGSALRAGRRSRRQRRASVRTALGAADRADGRLPGAARCLDRDDVADRPPHEGAAKRRVCRDAADGRDRDLHQLPRLVLDRDDGARADVIVGVVLDDDRGVQPRTHLLDARLEQPLLVLRGVVLEVLREIAERARVGDRLDRGGAARPFELGELRLESALLLGGENLVLRPAHGAQATRRGEEPWVRHRGLQASGSHSGSALRVRQHDLDTRSAPRRYVVASLDARATHTRRAVVAERTSTGRARSAPARKAPARAKKGTDLENFVKASGRAARVRDVRKQINASGVEYIYFQFPSVTGRIMGKGVPAKHWESIAEKGFQLVYGATANLFTDRHGEYIGYGPEAPELVGIPEPETFAQLPWDSKVARVWCTLFRNREERDEPGAFLSSDCRGNLHRIQADFEARTGLHLRAGTEPEMMWLKQNPDGTPSVEGLSKPYCYHIDQFSEFQPLIHKVMEYAEGLGLDMIQGDHEDAPGQLELNFNFDRAEKTADNLSTYRQICRQVGREMNAFPCFMPKPFMGVSANGCHHNISLWRGNTNTFMPEGATSRCRASSACTRSAGSSSTLRR